MQLAKFAVPSKLLTISLLAVLAAAACTSTQDLGNTAGTASDGGASALTELRQMEALCAKWNQSRSLCDAGAPSSTVTCTGPNCSDAGVVVVDQCAPYGVCAKRALKPEVWTALVTCADSLTCEDRSNDSPCQVKQLRPANSDDIDFSSSCELKRKNCQDAKQELPSNACVETPISAFNTDVADARRLCVSKSSCTESAACFEALHRSYPCI